MAISTWLVFLLSTFCSSIYPCFVVHYVAYFKDFPMKYYLHISQNSSFPYIVHLNQPLNLPNNKTFTREITPVQLSDIKKVEVIYHHGGLYLDNDQFIDYQCIKKHICNLKGLYFLDWTKVKQRWKNYVPLSFIYASNPFNDTLLRSLLDLNESREGDSKGPRTVYFSGPGHMQQYRSNVSFVLIPKNCQFHRADRTWVEGKPNNQLMYEKSIENKILRSYNQKQKKAKEDFVRLWATHTVIYPKNFDIGQQSMLDKAYNHVQILDKSDIKLKVIQFSEVKNTRRLLEEFLDYLDQKVEGKQNKILDAVSNRGQVPSIEKLESLSSHQPQQLELKIKETQKQMNEKPNKISIEQTNQKETAKQNNPDLGIGRQNQKQKYSQNYNEKEDQLNKMTKMLRKAIVITALAIIIVLIVILCLKFSNRKRTKYIKIQPSPHLDRPAQDEEQIGQSIN